MSSINPHYTFNYSQPKGYRFSHDSVFLARRAFELERENVRDDWRILDLCAGCGIVGLDFMFHCRQNVERVDFLEIQDEYRPHFEKNSAFVKCARFVHGNYAEFKSEEGYDLILCNPPYFRAGQGKLSPNALKNRSRFFIDSDFQSLFLAIERNLRGVAYVLLRDLKAHGVNPLQELVERFHATLKI